MPAFLDPFPGLTPDRRLTERELARAIRLTLSAEEEAVHLYEALADATDHKLAKAVLQEVAHEERVHAGEFLRLLSLLSAVDNVLEGINKLDSAGFRGPYALALAPRLFNLLFRRHPQGNQTELEHLRLAATEGIVKAPALGNGGVLVTAVKELAAIVLGQDLTTAFVGPKGRDYEFAISETAVLRLAEPASICVLR